MMATTPPESESRASPGSETGCTANPTTQKSFQLPANRYPLEAGSWKPEAVVPLSRLTHDPAPSSSLRRRRVSPGCVVLVRSLAVAPAFESLATGQRGSVTFPDRRFGCRSTAAREPPAPAARRGAAAAAAGAQPVHVPHRAAEGPPDRAGS